jgi:hypothetical protein
VVERGSGSPSTIIPSFTCYVPRIFPLTGSLQWTECCNLDALQNLPRKGAYKWARMTAGQGPGLVRNLSRPPIVCRTRDSTKFRPSLRLDWAFAVGGKAFGVRVRLYRAPFSSAVGLHLCFPCGRESSGVCCALSS